MVGYHDTALLARPTSTAPETIRFTANIDSSFLSYYVQGMKKTAVIGAVRALCDDGQGGLAQVSLPGASAIAGSLAGGATLTLPADPKVMTANAAK